MTDVKVSSYNIHSCVGADGLYSTDRLARVIAEGDAQIVCLQEVEVANHTVSPMRTRIWSSPHNDDQPAVIASLAGFDYHVFVPAIRCKASSHCREKHGFVSDGDVSGTFCDEHWKSKYATEEQRNNVDEDENDGMGKFGIAILSKYPIVEIRTHQYRRYKRKTLRNAMACRVCLPNNTHFWVVNTHLGCHFIGREQYLQSKELVTFVDFLVEERLASKTTETTSSYGVIVCGDFNSPPLLSSIRTLRQSGLCDVWQTSAGNTGLIAGGTFPSHARVLGVPFLSCVRKFLRLDYIFLHESGRREIVCKSVHVQDGGYDCLMASDHLPVNAIFLVGPLC